jgi:hypothetical protein
MGGLTCTHWIWAPFAAGASEGDKNMVLQAVPGNADDHSATYSNVSSPAIMSNLAHA